MLVALRSRAGSIFIKILMVFLAGTFALWGIADIFRQGGAKPIATVSHEEISEREFREAMESQMERLRSYLGDSYSPALVKQLGLPRQVLNNLINSRLIHMEAEALGLAVSDADVVEKIRTTQGFQGTNNLFDKALFEETLRNNRLTEHDYIAMLRSDMVANLLTELLTGVKPVLPSMTDTLYQIRHEERLAEIITLPAGLVTKSATPTDAQLAEYYKQHSAAFTTPEYRTFTYAALMLDDVSKTVTVPEDKIENAYQERMDEFRRPEQRKVDQMLFGTEDAAQKAYDRLLKKESFEKVASSSPISNKDSVSLGSVSKKDIPNEAADGVFALKAGEFTKPIHSSFGWHIFRVTHIEPGGLQSLEEARPVLVKELSMHEAEDTIYTLSNTLQDTLAAGKSLEEAAHAVGIKTQTVGPIDQDGNGPDGKAVTVPALEDFLQVGFALDPKATSQLTSSNSTSYYLVRADRVTPSQVKALAEVKEQVLQSWEKDQKGKQLGTVAAETAVALQAGKTPDVLKQASIKTAQAFNRSGSVKEDSQNPLPAQLTDDLFSRTAGQYTKAYPNGKGEYVIAKVTRIVPADEGLHSDNERKAAKDAVRSELEGQVSNELLEQYLRYLRTRYPVTIDDAAVDSMTE